MRPSVEPPCVACIVILALLASLGSAQTPEPRRFALLAGINQYQHDNLPDLKYAENDVEQLHLLLKQQGYDVTLLIGSAKDEHGRAHRRNIDEKLKTLLRQCRKGDTILVAFSGHGLQFIEDDDAYFCPLDGRPFLDEVKSMISLGEVYRDMQKSFAGMKVLLVDACRNDPTIDRGGIDADNSPPPPRGVAALFSCRSREKAYEHESLKHGVFFHYVLQGLRGDARDTENVVTFANLASYVSRKVPGDVAERIGNGAQQSPNLKADYSTEPVLARVMAAPPAALPANPVAPDGAPVRAVVVKPNLVLPAATTSYALDLQRVVEGGFPPGWKVDDALVVQNTSTGRVLIANQSGTYTAQLPNAVLNGDFFLETQVYLGGWYSGLTISLLGSDSTQDLAIAAFHPAGNTPCRVRVGAANAVDMASAGEFLKWSHVIRLECRGGILKVLANGKSVHSDRLAANSSFRGLEFSFNCPGNHYAADHHTAIRTLRCGPLAAP